MRNTTEEARQERQTRVVRVFVASIFKFLSEEKRTRET
jgi:hypothetical protein